MVATKMYTTAPGLPVRQHLRGINVGVGGWPYYALLDAADGTRLQVEWYPMTETWIVFCD